MLLWMLVLLCCRPNPGGSATRDTAAFTCPVTFVWTPDGTPDSVSLIGDFNDWDASATPMRETTDGVWSVTLDLSPGPWAYRFDEHTDWSVGGRDVRVCDPRAPLIHCDDGYLGDDIEFDQVCASGVEATCDSLIVVPDCQQPRLALTSLHIDRQAGRIEAEAAFSAGIAGDGPSVAQATLDGEQTALSVNATRIRAAFTDLTPGRHHLELSAVDSANRVTTPIDIPFWTDRPDPADIWRSGVMYFAFVDRLADGDRSNDGTEGATAPIADYAGGDWAGLDEMLPYLHDLGVTILWITNPLDNAGGAWAGHCGATYAGYHGYWPVSTTAVESHFGSRQDLDTLISDAHALGMRVVVDLILNHLHQDHPAFAAHPDWFTRKLPCDGTTPSGESNWDAYPETCWFADYLPDIDYTVPEALYTMVENAVDEARDLDIDGFRIDAVKHMPHSVSWNLAARIDAELEHREVGGDEDFWTVGETFDGRERIAAYLGELDGQFDFPLYWSIRGAFADDSTSMGELFDDARASEAAYGDATMSTFLGNHDMGRFVTQAAEGTDTVCDDVGRLRQATAPDDLSAYQRLSLAWVFLLTRPGVPLIYYGDEIGMPGYGDPDDRQPFWWAAGDAVPTSVDDLASRLPDAQAAVLYVVQRLARARAEHPAFWRGAETEWWRGEPDLLAYARVDDETGDAVLVALNRSDTAAALQNSLSFAGLPQGVTYVDLLSGDRFPADGDDLALEVPAEGARVLVVESTQDIQ